MAILDFAASPLDLIPDPIPVLGYLDDLILLPLAVVLFLRMIPPAVMAEARSRAQEAPTEAGRGGWVATAVIVLVAHPASSGGEMDLVLVEVVGS